MANNACLHVVLINAGGQLIHRQKSWGDQHGGSAGIESSTKSGLQVVGMWDEQDINGERGGPFWTEYSGRSMLAVEETFEGIAIAQRDTQPSKSDITEVLNDGTARAKRDVDSKLAESVMGKGANWDVYQDGQGGQYNTKLSEARTLVGVPS